MSLMFQDPSFKIDMSLMFQDPSLYCFLGAYYFVMLILLIGSLLMVIGVYWNWKM